MNLLTPAVVPENPDTGYERAWTNETMEPSDYYTAVQDFGDSLGSSRPIAEDSLKDQTVIWRPELIDNWTQTVQITSSNIDKHETLERKKYDSFDPITPEKMGMVENGTQTIEIPTPTPTPEPTPAVESDSSRSIRDRKDGPIPKPRAHIGSDTASRSIIAKDTQRVSAVFNKIVAGSYKKTGVSLGVLEVDGQDWASRFCHEHRYLNGILMAITVPRRLFLWHTVNFPVDEESWTKGSLIRTMSMVTESPRHLHSYPFRLTRHMPADQPKLLLHWDLESCGEPHVSARFKELVQAGGELQRRIGNFSYKQMVVCITLPWSVVKGSVGGRIPDHQDKALDFLERMGILSVIPVDERVDGKIEETNWCPSSIKVGDSDQSVTAYLQEVSRPALLLELADFLDYIHWVS
jgi:hypothetical protein